MTLHMDESMLTGESDVVRKYVRICSQDTVLAEGTNTVSCRTIVTSGLGRGFVIATGGNSAIGAIAIHIRRDIRPETSLQARIDRLGRTIAIVIFVASVAAFRIGKARGEDLSSLFGVVVATAVAPAEARANF